MRKHDWEYVASYLRVPVTSPYELELTKDGLIVRTNGMTIAYTHNEDHRERIIEYIRE